MVSCRRTQTCCVAGSQCAGHSEFCNMITVPGRNSAEPPSLFLVVLILNVQFGSQVYMITTTV